MADIAKRLLSRNDAAEYLSISRSTLDNLAATGKGPRRIKIGDTPQAAVRYDIRDLDAWIDAHRVGVEMPDRQPTSAGESKCISSAEAAKILGVSRQRIHQMILSGDLHGERATNGGWRFQESVVRASASARAAGIKFRDDPAVIDDLASLDLSARAWNLLQRNGVSVIAELCALTPQELLSIPNCGPGTFAEIVEKLARHGYRLSGSI